MLTVRHLVKYRPATFRYIFHPPHSRLLDRPNNYENGNNQQPIPRQTNCSHTAPQCPEHGPLRTEAACLSQQKQTVELKLLATAATPILHTNKV